MSKAAKLAESLKTKLSLTEGQYEDKAKHLKPYKLEIVGLKADSTEARTWLLDELEARQDELGLTVNTENPNYAFTFAKKQPFKAFQKIAKKLVTRGAAQRQEAVFEASPLTKIVFKDGYWRTVDRVRNLAYVGDGWYFEEELDE